VFYSVSLLPKQLISALVKYEADVESVMSHLIFMNTHIHSFIIKRALKQVNADLLKGQGVLPNKVTRTSSRCPILPFTNNSHEYSSEGSGTNSRHYFAYFTITDVETINYYGSFFLVLAMTSKKPTSANSQILD